MADSPTSADLAHRLNTLFDQVRPTEGGRRYTNDEVAAAVKAQYPHIRVGGAYLSALRNGTKRKPSTELLAALAHHFGVPITYFFSDEPPGTGSDHMERELAKLADNIQVRQLALRALDLSPEGLAQVAGLVERVLADQRQSTEDRRAGNAAG